MFHCTGIMSYWTNVVTVLANEFHCTGLMSFIAMGYRRSCIVMTFLFQNKGMCMEAHSCRLFYAFLIEMDKKKKVRHAKPWQELLSQKKINGNVI